MGTHEWTTGQGYTCVHVDWGVLTCGHVLTWCAVWASAGLHVAAMGGTMFAVGYVGAKSVSSDPAVVRIC